MKSRQVLTSFVALLVLLGAGTAPNGRHWDRAGVVVPSASSPGIAAAAPVRRISYWVRRQSGTTAGLFHVACPGPRTCLAVGLLRNSWTSPGVVLVTTNAGATWSSPTRQRVPILHGISCPTAHTCFSAGAFTWVDNEYSSRGTILRSTDAGATWRTVFTDMISSGRALLSVACPTVAVCLATGYGGSIVATTDGGATWRRQANPGVIVTSITCLSVTVCFATAGGSPPFHEAALLATGDGGETWTDLGLGVQMYSLLDVTCWHSSACFAVGTQGTILASTDAGRSWTRQANGTSPSETYERITCLSASACYIAGYIAGSNPNDGFIKATGDGGRSWYTAVRIQGVPMFGVTCVDSGLCVAVGVKGLILTGQEAP